MTPACVANAMRTAKQSNESTHWVACEPLDHVVLGAFAASLCGFRWLFWAGLIDTKILDWAYPSLTVCTVYLPKKRTDAGAPDACIVSLRDIGYQLTTPIVIL